MAKAKKLLKIAIANKSYQALTSIPIHVTPELQYSLSRKKKKDGTDLFTNLLTRGFSGGKHLIETLKERYGKGLNVVLSHKESHVSDSTITIDFNKFGQTSRKKFFSMYRETGLQSANEFLQGEFPDVFDKGKTGPAAKEVRKVLRNLPISVESLSQRERKRVPSQVAALVLKDTEFTYRVLKATEGFSESAKLAVRELISKIGSEEQPAKAMQELTDFMGHWNLLQVTSLLGILRSRLQTIETFEGMIHSEETYELFGDNSIHRVLEKSMWLIDDEYWIVASNKSLRTFIADELQAEDEVYAKNRPDFACATLRNKLILIEIKRPSIELTKRELDQVEDYLMVVRKYKAKSYSPIEAYLVGNKVSHEARERAELRKGMEILTYQDLLDKCRARYNEYLRIVES
jgi:hypothetical protein